MCKPGVWEVNPRFVIFQYVQHQPSSALCLKFAVTFDFFPMVPTSTQWILGLIPGVDARVWQSDNIYLILFIFYINSFILCVQFTYGMIKSLVFLSPPPGRTKYPELMNWWYVLCKYLSITLCKTGICAVTLLVNLDGRPIKSSDCWQHIPKGLNPFMLRWCASQRLTIKWCKQWSFGWKINKHLPLFLASVAHWAYLRKNWKPHSATSLHLAGSNHRLDR